MIPNLRDVGVDRHSRRYRVHHERTGIDATVIVGGELSAARVANGDARSHGEPTAARTVGAEGLEPNVRGRTRRVANGKAVIVAARVDAGFDQRVSRVRPLSIRGAEVVRLRGDLSVIVGFALGNGLALATGRAAIAAGCISVIALLVCFHITITADRILALALGVAAISTRNVAVVAVLARFFDAVSADAVLGPTVRGAAITTGAIAVVTLLDVLDDVVATNCSARASIIAAG